jgi:enoyl-CoA hydratase
MSDYRFLTIVRADGVAEVLVRKPPMNTLDPELYDELVRASEELEADEETRAVVFASALENVFIAGADIKQMAGYRFERDPLERKIAMVHATFNRLERLSKPTIAAITGHALGGGCELALALDFRFMSKGAPRIGLPEITLGILPGGGGTQRLPRVIGRMRAAELIMTGELLDAERAESIGLITRACEPERTREEARAFARRLAAQAPVALRAIKRCLIESAETTLAAGLEIEKRYCLEALLSEDAREGIAAFLEKRPPRWKGR